VESAGLRAVPQVGVSSYRIDIGVEHPSRPGEFILGIECDGAMYHSAITARDRDRLRQEVLERRGWKIHRIWSTDWFRQNQAARKRLLDVLQSLIR
jgi:very-short-patch-repair endonuclease